MSFWNISRILIAAITIVAVAELSKRFPRYGGLLLSLPLVSILAFVFSWHQYHDLPAISKLAQETLILVILGLPLMVPLAFAGQFGIGFWAAMAGGIVLASMSVGAWLYFGPTNQ
jgi:hypothetical protein